MTDVAIIGTGRMGAAMAHRLHDAGHTLMLWNRSPEKAMALSDGLGDGVAVAESPATAVRNADVVLSVLASGAITEQVLLSDDVLASLTAGTVVVDMGTSGVGTARALADALGRTPAVFVDAPVSGSVATVAAGELLIMASGPDDAIDGIESVLGAFSKRVARLGDAGNGQAMKLAVNLVVHGLNAVLSEALALAETAGIDRAGAYDVLSESVVAAPFVTYKRAAFLFEDTPVAFTLRLVEKDLSLITGLAETLGVPVEVTDAVVEAVSGANGRGQGERDMAHLRADIVDRIGRA